MIKRDVSISFEDCSECGSHDLVITTDSESDEYFWDGDECTCLDCGNKGAYMDGDNGAYIEWDML